MAPRRFQSGERDYDERVSKCGDAMMRTALYEAAQVLLTRSRTWSWLKARGMWVDGTEFCWRKEVDTAAA